MKIFIGADHRGFKLKEKIKLGLEKAGHSVEDLGTFTDEEPCDYPVISYRLAKKVVASKDGRGILVCMSGIGHSIAANKVKGAYAALCYNQEAAGLSRAHNNANILILGAKFVSSKAMQDIIEVWMKTPFEGGRHLRRVNEIVAIERKEFKGHTSKVKRPT